MQRVDPPRAVAPVAPMPPAMQPQARREPAPSAPPAARQAPQPTVARPAAPQPQVAHPAPPPSPQQPQQSAPRGDHDRGQARDQRRGEGRGAS